MIEPSKRFPIEPLKRLHRTPKASIEAPFGPRKGSIEPQRKGFQNHRKGSIEPFASTPPFSGYLLKLSLAKPATGNCDKSRVLSLCVLRPVLLHPVLWHCLRCHDRQSIIAERGGQPLPPKFNFRGRQFHLLNLGGMAPRKHCKTRGFGHSTPSEKRNAPSRTWGEIILEMLWKPQMPLIIGLGGSQPYSGWEFQETL